MTKKIMDTEEVLSIDKPGSPNGLIHRTFHAVFEMPVAQLNHNLIKFSKRQFRNPIYLAREWQALLDHGKFSYQSELAHYLRVSRARVTQILNLLKLTPEVIEMISSLGDPLKEPTVSERGLRTLLALNAEQQKTWVKIMLR